MPQDDGRAVEYDVDKPPSGVAEAAQSLPAITFDERMLDDPAMPVALQGIRADGIRKHLWRYGNQVSARNAITRLEDPAWLAAWDAALASTANGRVALHGSELGVFALRALHHGAAHVQCVEAYPLEARIASGIVQKHFMKHWRARHGEAIASWTEAEQRASFESLASCVDIITDQQSVIEDADWLIFPQIDHTLLGTGIAKAVRQFLRRGGKPARVLPARARVFAMGIAWRHEVGGYRLEPLNAMRWSPYPQPLDLASGHWEALSEPVEVGVVDFANFSEADWHADLPMIKTGAVDAIVFWFELELGPSRIRSGPDSPLRWLKPAVQYCDPVPVAAGGTLALHIQVTETRLHFRPAASARGERSGGLPGWYVPMLGDTGRLQAYREALSNALDNVPDALVLDPGAGCGLLAMLAADAGAQRVVGCEAQAGILHAGREALMLNGRADRVALIGKDARKMRIPEDLPRRADLAVFDLFDCSLIGEGVLHYLAYAREHLLAKQARYVPAKARLRAMLVEYRLEAIWQVDVNLLNPYRAHTGFVNVDATKLDYRPLSQPFDVFAFDFATAVPEPQETLVRVAAMAAGTVGAVLFWFDLELDEQRRLSNAPRSDTGLHWKQGLQMLPEFQVKAGGEMPLRMAHDGSSLSFRWQADALPKEALSTLPRWDPRWLAAGAELEQQTQALLQHCARHPDEYAQAAQIALRLAVDPAAHGIDPGIAQRFASIFLNAR